MSQRVTTSLETDIRWMMTFLRLGRTAKLRERVNVAYKHRRFATEERLQFARIQASLEVMEDFERKYGIGSCLNVEMPELLKIADTCNGQFDPDEIAAAQSAPSAERVNILAWAAEATPTDLETAPDQ
ncbi:hypothetical protein [Rhizobium sp. 18055]|uniref:hypothetical protein n=1 Tax=Rhizobium sp. 18055 TaxID=2681403 RepID=UPI00135A834C|nr:hypothetical protein [Rhizobium sp. 18055]